MQLITQKNHQIQTCLYQNLHSTEKLLAKDYLLSKYSMKQMIR
ncbi:unnamed protein product [Paramecium octaurelia]|uniref:Uncharacterized protein n=1 Tax=Paramecium octaurelia TaxID=43137 RepID=A0A8S1T8L0_PAROT|nr:unnamed protein product [Paramecium octaurelia]